MADPVASVARVELAAGAAATVTFDVHTDRLSFTGRDLKRIVEPGEIIFRIGTAAAVWWTPPVRIAAS